ncbi:MAG: MFS transporter [Chloroflexota bacterium]|nr:MFS transporter [Chloroflexota bacterium]
MDEGFGGSERAIPPRLVEVGIDPFLGWVSSHQEFAADAKVLGAATQSRGDHIAREYPAFLLIQVITGTGFAFASGSVDAIIYDSLPEGDRTPMQRAKGLIGAATQTGSVVAYSIGGVIAADLSLSRMTITIVMGATAVAMAATLSFGLREPPDHAQRVQPDSIALVRSAWRAIRETPELRRVIGLAIATCAFGAHLLVFYQQYFLETGVPGLWFGLGLSIASVAVVVAQYVAWRLPIAVGTRRAMLIATRTPGVLYIAMAINSNPWGAVVLFVMQWGMIHLSVPLFAGLFNAYLPDEARATGLSVITAVITVYVGVGGVAFGWLAGRSLPLTFAVIGTIVIVGAIAIRLPDERPVVAYGNSVPG